MTSPPQEDEVGLNHVVISWQAEQENQDSEMRPAYAYKVYRRYTEEGADWENIGLVRYCGRNRRHVFFQFDLPSSGTRKWRSASRPLILCSGEEGELGPALTVTTNGRVAKTLHISSRLKHFLDYYMNLRLNLIM